MVMGDSWEGIATNSCNKIAVLDRLFLPGRREPRGLFGATNEQWQEP
jgi:hypothetical protein